MSRSNTQNGDSLLKKPEDDGEINALLHSLTIEPDNICPVCKSSRYLNQNMFFQVNPECYHRMCGSCVDRIFSSGPAPCPVAGCARTLRKAKFRKQTFEDIKVEREVDIRRRVADVFNRREDEFQTLMAYNNYLEKIETLTFNLVYNIDVKATEQELASYAQQHATSISKNQKLQLQESANAEAQLVAQKEQAKIRRAEAFREEEDERREREEGKRELVQRLASGTGDADQIVRESQKVQLKKSSARGERARIAQLKQQSQARNDGLKADNGTASGGFTIEGLKPVEEVEPEKPYDPFGGMKFERDYYVPQEDYEHPELNGLKADQKMMAGGYNLREYYARTMLEAFAGLGVFVEEEMAQKNLSGGVVTATAAAAVAGGDDPGRTDEVL